MSIRSARQSLTRTNTVDRSKIRAAGEMAVYDGDFDPYYSSVAAHLSDSDYTVTLMTDWSANKWDNMSVARSYALMDGRIPSTMGPRSQHWATEYSYYGFHTYADTPQLRFGYNNFTIEFWIKLEKQSASEIYVMSKGAGAAKATGSTGWVIGINSSYQPFFFDGITGVTITAPFVMSRDTWHHVAFVRSSTGTNGFSIYINGALSVQGTAAGNYSDTGTLRIGRDRNSTIGATSFWGFLTDIRIQTGRVPSILLSTDAAGLITCQSTIRFNINDPVMFTGTTQGGIVVGTIYYIKTVPSTTTFTMSISPGGATFVTTASTASTLTANALNYTPVVPTLPTGPLDMTGPYVILSQSMAFPDYSDQLGRMTHSTDSTRRIDSPFYVHSEQTGHGVGAIAQRDKDSWLKFYDAIPGNTSLRFGTGNFTVEAWIYPQANYGITSAICGKGSTGWTFYVNGSGYLEWYDNTTTLGATDTRNRISSGGWYHVAAVRTSTAAGGFRMYVNGLMVYSGTLATNYADTDPFMLFVDRNYAVTGCSGMISGLAISKIARYNPAAVSTGVTATDAYGVITCDSTAGFVPGDKVTFTGTQGGITATSYWIFTVLDGTRFTISSTQGGGQFVTTVSSASGVLTASLTPRFSVSGTAFLDQQMTVDSNHSLLIGTCGTQPVVNNQAGMLDKGQGRLNYWRSNNEMRSGGGAPYSRHGYSLQFRNGAQNQMKAFVNASNPNDFTFGTNDFSIEFWYSNFRHSSELVNNHGVILDTRSAWNDTGIRIRQTSGMALDVLTSGRILLTTNNNRFTEFTKTTNTGPNRGTPYATNGLFAPRVWTHVCVQRVSNNLALYINGVKNTETYYTTAINTPLGKIIIGNSNWAQTPYSNNYDSGMFGWLSDIRICNGTAAYGADTKNPPTIPVPTAPLPTRSNCVLLISNTSSYLQDQSGRRNRIGFEQTNTNAGSSWDVKHVAYSPYQGVDFDHNTQIYGFNGDTYMQFYTSSANARYNQTSHYNDLTWINRMNLPWTIEGFFWSYQTGDATRSASVELRTLLETCGATAGHDGFRLMWNMNSSGTTAFGDLTLEFRNFNAPQTQYLGTTSGLTANGGEGNFKPHTWNHFAFQYDPTKTNKMAIFINGYLIATRAAFTPNNSTNGASGLTYSLGVLSFMSGVRISRIGRYNNDGGVGSTYTVPTSYPVDQYTWSQPSAQYPIMNDKKIQSHMYGPYGCTLSTHYKKFGVGSIRLGNREANTDSDPIKYARISLDNNPNYTNHNMFTVRDGDFTIECWAAWSSAANGGIDFSTAGYGNFLWTLGQGISVGVNSTGYWKFQHVPSHTDAQHWIYNVGQSPYVNTQTPYTAVAGYGYQLFQTNVLVAQPTLASPNTFDHVVVQRKSNCFYFYINGVEMAVMSGNQNLSYGAVNNTVYAPLVNFDTWDIYDATGNIELGGDGSSTGGRYWCGWVQDFRTTTLARYDTVSINGVPTMCYAGTYTPALPTKLYQIK